MASSQTRRVTRTAGRTTVLRDKENATARQGRTAASRAKPPSTQSAADKPENAKPPGVARATASTAATRAKSVGPAGPSKADPAPQIKRKREALGDVPKPPENRAKPANAGPGPTDLKGKERVKEIKEKFEGVVLKQTTTTTLRKPLRTVVDSTTTSTTVTTTTRRTRDVGRSQGQSLQPLREDDEDAMAVDPQPHIAPIPSPKRFVAAREAVRSGIPAKSHVPKRISKTAKAEVDEEEANRVTKKRRTSSEPPEAHEIEVEELEQETLPVEEAEADPDGDNWDDLDAEDADDPLMVSEYVVEIFEYLKEVEVCSLFLHICAL